MKLSIRTFNSEWPHVANTTHYTHNCQHTRVSDNSRYKQIPLSTNLFTITFVASTDSAFQIIHFVNTVAKMYGIYVLRGDKL